MVFQTLESLQQKRRTKARSRSATPRNSRTSSPHPSRLRMSIHGLPVPAKLLRESVLLVHVQHDCQTVEDGSLQPYINRNSFELLLRVYKRPQELALLNNSEVFVLLETVNYLDVPRIYSYVTSELARRMIRSIAGPVTQELIHGHRDCLVDVMAKLPEVKANILLRRRICSRLEYRMAFPKRPVRWRTASETSQEG
eukprot:TRINITY_DN10255_c0_g1_i1.p2 TRINITY_DN10255_c0_g1~~TRINITY_DN10255_c0_g1_i1.p2  ORF type:complete len:197 (+),score=18.22 TRINITY_DN10255_c0_g1_i1:1520-2110(+)